MPRPDNTEPDAPVTREEAERMWGAAASKLADATWRLESLRPETVPAIHAEIDRARNALQVMVSIADLVAGGEE